MCFIEQRATNATASVLRVNKEQVHFPLREHRGGDATIGGRPVRRAGADNSAERLALRPLQKGNDTTAHEIFASGGRFRHRKNKVNGISLHSVVGGAGPAVLFLHGWSLPSTSVTIYSGGIMCNPSARKGIVSTRYPRSVSCSGHDHEDGYRVPQPCGQPSQARSDPSSTRQMSLSPQVGRGAGGLRFCVGGPPSPYLFCKRPLTEASYERAAALSARPARCIRP